VSGFIAGAVVFLILGAGIILLRRGEGLRPADAQDPNLDWYRQRELELQAVDTEGEQLLEDAQLRLLEDGTSNARDPLAPAKSAVPRLALVLVVVVLSSLIYLRTGSIEDVMIFHELNALTPEDGEAARTALLGRIQARSEARPDNLQYLSLLGRLYMAAEDFPAASDSFGRLADKAPEDPQALALAAQARFLAADRTLDSKAQLLAEQALAVDPEQRTALSLLGMASFERGAFGAAVNYWERLQAFEAPGSSSYQVLGDVIALARERGGLEVDTAQPAQESSAAQGPGISVALSLAGEAPDPQATVFVFARPADRGGMPVAVRRLRAADLPVTLRLVDGDAMAGQLLSEAGAVLVSAQLSANGQPGMANALFSGVAGPVTAGGTDATVSIELQSAPEQG
jgi:cytochrome c-type biogenesis protein CcmH